MSLKSMSILRIVRCMCLYAFSTTSYQERKIYLCSLNTFFLTRLPSLQVTPTTTPIILDGVGHQIAYWQQE